MAQAIMRRRKVCDYSKYIGKTWTLTKSSGTFTAPYPGKYQVEMHGGGGGPSYHTINGESYSVATGGGSGEVYEVILLMDEPISYTVGVGGTKSSGGIRGKTGGTTTFGDDLSIAGGGGGYWSTSEPEGGTKSGSIATNGAVANGSSNAVAGGYGNKNKPSQPYGNGGGFDGTTVTAGNDGGIIITYLGEE